MDQTTTHWNKVYRQRAVAEAARPDILLPALAHFGDVRGKTILDLGCGQGMSSLFFAAQGAQVIAVDNSLLRWSTCVSAARKMVSTMSPRFAPMHPI